MPRINRTNFQPSDAYQQLRSSSALASRETNDCAVVAVAAACGVSYDEAHGVLAAAGRKNRKGTYPCLTYAAIAHFGFKLTRVPPEHFISRYPGVHSKLRSVTTHHMDRFPRVWADGHTYLIHVTRHVLAVVDGVNMDWSRGCAKRAQRIYRLDRIA